VSKRQELANAVMGVLRKKIPVTVTLAQDQIDFIDSETGETGQRSRWIRSCIDREIGRKKQFSIALREMQDEDPPPRKVLSK
jgi:hypothetical protein